MVVPLLVCVPQEAVLGSEVVESAVGAPRNTTNASDARAEAAVAAGALHGPVHAPWAMRLSTKHP